MSTFWGCEPEAMEDLARTMEERARQLIELLERLREATSALAWTGPDAVAHRRATEQVIAQGLARGQGLQGLAEDLLQEAAEQERASAAAQSPGTARDPGGGTGRPPLPPLPPGESFALDPAYLAHAEQLRRTLAKRNPYTRAAQVLMDTHASLEELAADAEDLFDERGWEIPAALAGAYGHYLGVTGLLVGEQSTLGQATEGLERMVANGEQTLAEVGEAVVEGDGAAALRAGERGLLRHTELQGELLMAGPGWYLGEAIGHMAGGTGDLLEPVAPEAAETLFEAERAATEMNGYLLGAVQDRWDAESWYDARRRVAPMPWDPFRDILA